jgi:hypothetical protein
MRARNYGHEEAQKRLTDTVDAFNQQVLNSLRVDAVEVQYFHIRNKVGKPCSCVSDDADLVNSAVGAYIPTEDNDQSRMEIRFQDTDIFGESQAERILNDRDVDYPEFGSGRDGAFPRDEVLDVSGEEMAGEGHVGNSFNTTGTACGICYRTRVLPGYIEYGHTRYLFTHADIVDQYGYAVEPNNKPYSLRNHDEDDGYVVFELPIPRVWKSVSISIRNNSELMPAERLYDSTGQVLTANAIRAFNGKQIQVRVKAAEFTHLVVDFEMNVEPMFANMSGEQMALDYDTLITLSDISLVLPPSLKFVDNGDVIYIPKRNLTLKVRDKTRKITADKRQLGWLVNARVLQPTEDLRYIAHGYKLRPTR